MTTSTCPRCGKPLASDAPGGLCAACLLAASAESLASAETLASGSAEDDLPTMTSGATPHPRPGDASTLQPESVWGPYRIGRLLGRGGMGEVYEAEHVPSGRRVALKILRHRLQTQNERARFLREGQLAASVSHPHTVYIFGSEEIEGTPVISMELLTGGTLKDRVVAHGPMSPDEAVAAILDLIGGLDAAAAAGILHRDIKPSNCFVDRDGVVKVGDFGLSISTLARDVHQQLVTSGFEGTPQFAPPEQLRGEPLDVRADIYAVGATLYYLLTGRTPFDAPDLKQLFDKVTAEAPAPLRQVRRDLPARLSAVVMQCLAKNPAERPASYPVLADALRPFLARDDKPAPLGTRIVAAILDSWVIVGVPTSVAVTLLADPLSGSPDRTALIQTWSWVVTFAYYLALEGATGRSLGKRLFGMRVLSADGSAASWRQILIRTTVFYVPDVVFAAALTTGVFADNRFAMVRVVGSFALSAAMFFSTARRHNGWTGLHDVVSGTRVKARPEALVRHARVAQPIPASALADGTVRRYGPFVAMDNSERGPGAVVRAFDPVLRRQVWIEISSAGTPAISEARRDLSRPERLHWLTGRRSADENWDAYEAPDGVAWTTAVASSAWSQTKLHLLDLANELASSKDESTLPPLSLDRIWLRDNGRIVLLDFAPPDATSRAAAILTPEQLLQAAASRVPKIPDAPASIPLSARAFLERWSGPSVPTLHEARAALLTMAAAPDHVQLWRRALPGVLAATPVALMLLVSVAIIPALSRFTTSETAAMMNLLGALRSKTLPADNPFRRPEVRAAAEVAVAGRYGDLIRSEDFWNAGFVRSLAPDYRPMAEEILNRYPDVSREQLTAAEAVLKEARPRPPGRRPQQRNASPGGIVISTVTAGALALALALCVISSLLVPGGLVQRHLGLATITRSGTEITRMRSLARVLVAGIPGIVWLTYLALAPKVQGFVPTPTSPITATLTTVSILALGLAWTVARRTRGPHDIVVGTWVVPR
ncbi:MAG TPA: protein kinase [Vicinamibacterales bacterium]|nr:protein kinase [Vicinamibacterales bacterium]